jgi:hypothetical protein
MGNPSYPERTSYLRADISAARTFFLVGKMRKIGTTPFTDTGSKSIIPRNFRARRLA